MQLHMQCFDILNIEYWNVQLYKKMKIYIKCEIKTASRREHVIVNK